MSDLSALALRVPSTSSIPRASLTSDTATHLLCFLPSCSDFILSWPLLREALEAIYGPTSDASVRMDAIESGGYGLNLVARAFKNEEKDRK